MILTHLKIRQMPGIVTEFEISADGERMNIVEGPNGSGKTTLCRAVQALFWPTASHDRAIGATFTDTDGTYTASTGPGDGGAVRWRRNGDPCEPPCTPPAHLAACILLRIDEIMPADQSGDDEMARRIAKEMAGGFDLDSVAALDEFKSVVYRNLNSDYLEKVRQYEKLVRDQAAIAEREKELPILDQKRQSSDEARAEIAMLQTGVALAKTRETLAALDAAAQDFPADMDKLSADDNRRLKQLTDDIAAKAADITAADRRIETASRAIEASSLPGGKPVDETELGAWDRAAQDWARLESALEHDTKARVESAARHERVRASVAPRGSSDAPNLSPDAIAEAAACVQELLELRRARAPIEDALSRPDPVAPASADSIARATEALAGWLALPDAAPAADKLAPYLMPIFAVVVIMAPLFVHIFKLQNPLITGLLLIISAAIGAIGARLATRTKPDTRTVTLRAEIEQRYASFGLPTPLSWTRDAVRAAFDNLAPLAAAAAVAADARVRRASLEAELAKTTPAAEAAERKRADIEQRYALDLGWNSQGPLWYLDTLIEYRQAASDLDEAVAAERATADQLAAVAATVNAFLAASGADECPSATLAAASLLQLRQRSTALANALAERDRATADRDAAITKLAERNAELAAFLAERSCVDEADFAVRFERLPDWQKLSEDKRQSQAAANHAIAQLHARPDLVAEAAATLAAKLADAERLAAEYTSVTQNIEAIKAAVTAARAATDTEKARDLRDVAKEEVAAKRENALFAVAGQFMLEQVESEHRQTSSGILQQASALFARFTNNAYTLRVVRPQDRRQSARYSAFDTTHSTTKSLAELSAGTRIQLLIAARVAFAVSSQGDSRMPLFFDEVLKHSDPERTQAIVKALAELLRQNRQIFYLTNEPLDVTRISAVLAGEKLLAPNVIDLAAIRRLHDGWRGGQTPQLPERTPVPLTDGLTAREYASRIVVTRFDPTAPVDSAHLFYALDDHLSLLYDALVRGVETVGAWRNRDGRVHLRLSGITAAAESTIDSRCNALAAFVDAYRQGRPAPLTYDALLEARVSATFLPRIWEACQAVNGDAKHLLAAISAGDFGISRFQKTKYDELAEYCRDRGYLTDTQPLTANEITAIVCAAAPEIAAEDLRAMTHRWYDYAAAAGEDTVS
ncbi:MAG TPA: hypothetical protein VGK19_12480 [Capsulimonadaceae bacterium]|jgi:hypothetical protein